MSTVVAQRGRSPLFTFREGTPPHRAYQTFGWALFVVPLLVAPYILPSFRVSQLAQSAAWAVAILGMNMVLGYSGLISLGHIAFVGVGAYTTMILMNYNDFDMWMTLPFAFVICFLFGALVGLPALKIRGLYLALVTLALAYTFPILLKIEQGGIAKHTGGDNGRTLNEKMSPTSWMRSLLHINGRDEPTQVAIYKYFALVLIARTIPQVEAWFARRQQIHKEPSLAVTIAIGAVGGFLVGLTSIGSGTLFGVALILLFGLSARELVGTDIVHGCILTMAAAWGHVWVGNVDYPLVGSLLVGAIPGILLGGYFSTRMPENALRPAIGTVLLLSGLKILL